MKHEPRGTQHQKENHHRVIFVREYYSKFMTTILGRKSFN
jgi:hypothetical protein